MRFCLAFLGAITVVSAQTAPNMDAANIRLGGLAYPRVALDFQGGTTKIGAPAKRIVTLSNHVDEYLYQFLPGERIVGVSRSSYDEPFSAVLDKVKKYHPEIVKDAESILRLKPDLVLTSDSMSVDASGPLRAAGVPVFSINTTPLTLDEIAANIAALGYITGADESSKAELDRYQREIAQVREQCKAPHGDPRIFGVSMTGFSYGDHTLFQDMMQLVRASNVAAQNGMHTYQRVDAATVATWNPDYVFTWALEGKKDQELRRWMEDDPGLRATSAAKLHHITVLRADEVLPLSPLTTRFIRAIANVTCRTK